MLSLALSFAPATEALDPMSLLLGASGPVFVILWCLLGAAGVSWMIIVLKLRQLGRWEQAERLLIQTVGSSRKPEQLGAAAAGSPDALGGVVLRELVGIRTEPDLLQPTLERALHGIQQRMTRLMTVLSSVGAVAPFVGLLGTVYGILDAFLRIGREQSASLPVVAPAIGEALIVTAVGLFAAIPAVLAFNFLNRRIDELLTSIRVAAGVWVQILRRGT